MLWLRALYAIAIVAALLVALNYILRTMQRGGTFGLGERMVEVLETTPLANASALHLVRIAEGFYVIGGGQAQATLTVRSRQTPSRRGAARARTHGPRRAHRARRTLPQAATSLSASLTSSRQRSARGW